jgi:hypothetical protein
MFRITSKMFSSDEFLCTIHDLSTKVTGMHEGCRVLDGSAHLLSRALVNQSATVACCTLYLSPRATHLHQ